MTYDLDELKRAADLVELAADLGLEPKKQGSTHVARCPAHNDQGRPNLVIYPDNVHCFGCGFHGSAIDLVMKAKKLDFKGAADLVARRFGILPKGETGKTRGQRKKPKPSPPKAAPLPPTPSPYLAGAKAANEPVVNDEKKRVNPPPWPPRQPLQGVDEIREFFAPYGGLPRGPVEAYALWEELEDLLSKPTVTAAEWDRAFAIGCRVGYWGDLPPVGETARASGPNRVEVFTALLEYASPLSLSSEVKGAKLAAAWLEGEKGIFAPTVERFGLCWLDWEAADQGMKKRFDLETLKGFGLVNDKGELRFKYHRLLTPFTWRGKPVFLQGRNFKATGKQSRFLNPSGGIPLPFNADALVEAEETGKPVFLCEGATDTLTLAQSGRLAVGIVGTQGFKREWARYFAGLKVYLAFDGDEAGRRAGRDVSKVFVDHNLAAPKVIPIPDGLDVTSFFKQGREDSE